MINSRFAIFLLHVGAIPGCLCHASGSQRQMWWGRSFLNLTKTSHLCIEIPLEFQHWCLLWLPVLLSCAKTLWCAQMVTGDYRRSSDLRQIEFNLWSLEVSFLVGVFHQSLLILGRWAPLSPGCQVSPRNTQGWVFLLLLFYSLEEEMLNCV